MVLGPVSMLKWRLFVCRGGTSWGRSGYHCIPLVLVCEGLFLSSLEVSCNLPLRNSGDACEGVPSCLRPRNRAGKGRQFHVSPRKEWTFTKFLYCYYCTIFTLCLSFSDPISLNSETLQFTFFFFQKKLNSFLGKGGCLAACIGEDSWEVHMLQILACNHFPSFHLNSHDHRVVD